MGALETMAAGIPNIATDCTTLVVALVTGLLIVVGIRVMLRMGHKHENEDDEGEDDGL